MTLKTEDFSALSRLLDQALDLSEPEREAWLATLPAEDRAFEALLREMLAAQSGQGCGPRGGLLETLPRLAAAPTGPAAQPGDRVGPYRLQRLLGHGGMGTVWLAERADGVLSRQVALKLPRLTWDDGLARRVARERDLCARLEHPHIARLYDAGVDEQGRPYLAFEFIDGLPIDVWCLAHGLPLDERLALFVQVARAVAFAHARLVLHRDIKPSNVLVTGDGQAHLLDFGIGKLLHEGTDAAHGTAITREHGRALTPRYASPEQLRGEPVTVASDVYSLGVLLFELLSGQPRHDPALRGLAALERVVLDEEAPLASSRASGQPWARALRGELDAIVAKALKRDPAQRYPTADALADDIGRRLRGERVLARPDSAAYRVASFLRRHRVGVLASSAVLLVLLGGVVAALLQAQRAGAAAERANAVKAFVIDIFQVNSSGAAELRALPAELLLERGAELVEGKFPGQPELQAELYGVVGGIFAEMAAHERAATYATRQLAALDAAGAAAPERARALLLLGRALQGQRRFDEARARLQQALQLAAGRTGLQGSIWLAQAQVEYDGGSAWEAARLLDRAEAALAAGDGQPVDRVHGLVLRANLLSHANHFDQAEPRYRQAIDLARRLQGPLSPLAAGILLTLQIRMLQAMRPLDADPLGVEALAMLRASGTAGRIEAAISESRALTMRFASYHPSFAGARQTLQRHRDFLATQAGVPEGATDSVDHRLMQMALRWGDLAEAERLDAATVPALLARASTPASVKVEVVMSRAQLRYMQGRYDEAAAAYRRMIDLQHQVGSVSHPYRMFAFGSLALVLIDAGRLDEAEKVLDAAPPPDPVIRGGAPASAQLSLRLQRARALLALRRGDAGRALALAEAAGDGWDPWIYGEALCAAGRAADGLALLERPIATYSAGLASHPWLVLEQVQAGHCALTLGRRARAAELAASAAQARRVHAPWRPPYVQPLEALQRRLRGSP